MKTRRNPVLKEQSSDHTRWEALIARSPQAEGAFVYGVKSTGIFCRPNCHSRLPKRANVRFFDSAAEALESGFRPCKRCQPAGQSYEAELKDRMLRACRLLEQAAGPMPLKALASRVGFSPYHFHRLFKAHLGLTPNEYQAACRMTRFKGELRRKGDVSAALYQAGFGSASRAYEEVSRKLGMTPRQFQRGGQGLELAYGFERTSLGLVVLAASQQGVCAIEIGDNQKALRDRLRTNFPDAILREDQPALAKYFEILRRYLESPIHGLPVPLDMRGTAFQQRVWRELKRVPLGKTCSYQAIARRLGIPTSVRAVAGAIAANKIAVAIPCHRVVHADGSLSGYRWGVDRKRVLLEGEKKYRDAG